MCFFSWQKQAFSARCTPQRSGVIFLQWFLEIIKDFSLSKRMGETFETSIRVIFQRFYWSYYLFFAKSLVRITRMSTKSTTERCWNTHVHVLHRGMDEPLKARILHLYTCNLTDAIDSVCALSTLCIISCIHIPHNIYRARVWTCINFMIALLHAPSVSAADIAFRCSSAAHLIPWDLHRIYNLILHDGSQRHDNQCYMLPVWMHLSSKYGKILIIII
jgi:hypothetical protein